MVRHVALTRWPKSRRSSGWPDKPRREPLDLGRGRAHVFGRRENSAALRITGPRSSTDPVNFESVFKKSKTLMCPEQGEVR
jgi:hypothetical protein